MGAEQYVIYIDTGGTFTDAVVLGADGNYVTGKAPTTPDDLQISFFGAIADAVEKMGKPIEEVLKKATQIGYGTTFGTNMIVAELAGPKVGFLTTKGVEDRLSLGRLRTAGLQKIQAMHMISSGFPRPLVVSELIKGIDERIDAKGKVVVRLSEASVRNAVDELLASGVEAIAVGFLWSFLNGKHEERARELILEQAPHLMVGISSEIAPTIREYPRFTSTIIDLKIGKGLRELLVRIERKAKELGYERPLLVMQAIGGTCQSKTVHPGTTLHSGPVGGLAGVKFLKDLYGLKKVMGSDVGGTSFDVTVVTEKAQGYLRTPIVGRYEIATPMCEIITVGSGGGTIAWLEEVTNALRVGPHSAGSTPGPVCYDAGGTEPTVTDADLVMNRIDPTFFHGGKRKLDRDKALKAIKERIADPLGIDVYYAAEGICRIVDNAMGSLLKQAIGTKGLNPKEVTLLAFGGGGPLHCAGYSSEIDFEKVIIPSCASVYSAFGASTGDLMHHYETSPLVAIPNLPYDPVSLQFELDKIGLQNLAEGDPDRINYAIRQLQEKAYRETGEEGYAKEEIRLKYEFLGRYGGQLWEIRCPLTVERIATDEDVRTILKAFEREYLDNYTKQAMVPSGGLEIISIGLTATAPTTKPKLLKHAYVSHDASEAVKGEREVFCGGTWTNTRIYDAEKLRCGNVVTGMAVIEASDTTIFVPVDRKITVDEYLNLVMEKA